MNLPSFNASSVKAPSFTGDSTGTKAQRGMLFEYNTDIKLVLEFEFNPSSMTRTRSVTIKSGGLAGTRGGYDFQTASEAQRAAQGVSVAPENFSIEILLDATDRMNSGDTNAAVNGIQPEIDMIRSMMEPKSQQPDGAQKLKVLAGNEKSFPQYQTLSVLLFKWGKHTLPVFLTRAQFVSQDYLPSLVPYRARVTLDMQVIESNNPFYVDEIKRQSDVKADDDKKAAASNIISSAQGGKGV